MKKHITTIIVAVMFLAGLSLLLYPFTANQWNNYRQSKLLTTYEETVTEMAETGRVDYEAEWVQAQNYNEDLIPYILPDSFSTAEYPEEGDEKYLSCLNLTGDGMMGFIQIPKISVKIPIYHTTSDEVLQKAAGHLAGSSLPVGGEGTHAVISAHRGLPSAALFTDLDKLEEGDTFFLSVLDDILCYEVDLISVVEPTDTDALKAEDGQDLVTLLTCTSYGVNSHRLLVRGHRVPYTEFEEDSIPVASGSGLIGASMHTSYLLWVIIGLMVTGLFILLLYLYDRKLKKAKAPAGMSLAGSEETILREKSGRRDRRSSRADSRGDKGRRGGGTDSRSDKGRKRSGPETPAENGGKAALTGKNVDKENFVEEKDSHGGDRT